MTENSPAGGGEESLDTGDEQAWFLRQSGSFVPAVLDKTVISIPLLRLLKDEDDKLAAQARRRKSGKPDARQLFPVIINLNWDLGREEGLKLLEDLIDRANKDYSERNKLDPRASKEHSERNKLDPMTFQSTQYAFASLIGPVIRTLVRLDDETRPDVVPEGQTTGAHRVIYSIWPDFEVRALLTKSYTTVKADAARAAFAAMGDGIVWAVLDSGIDKSHPHFQRHANFDLPAPLKSAHRNFTDDEGDAYVDEYGHGTHVAGIIAGEMSVNPMPGEAPDAPKRGIKAFASQVNEDGKPESLQMEVTQICGVAPRCKLLSIKVLNKNGVSRARSIIVALEHVHQLNKFGRQIIVHGVNLSVGYGYEPEWFACGQSPLCEAVDLLVRSGVVVVVAAGNTGYGWLQAFGKRDPVSAAMDLSINDPGNAELAITVGSTHREKPHLYGVSYFSSKGPTGDGRLKPDLVAPGEKIISCAAGLKRKDADLGKMGITRDPAGKYTDKDGVEYGAYVEDSGTSMAAPHVSGAIAAFLSIRKEFIGRPERVKEIFCSTATDLKRERHFQGYGLVDLMRAIQSV
jgi:serine protease AprX